MARFRVYSILFLMAAFLYGHEIEFYLAGESRMELSDEGREATLLMETGADWQYQFSPGQSLNAAGGIRFDPDPYHGDPGLSGDVTQFVYRGRFPHPSGSAGEYISINGGRREIRDLSGLVLAAYFDGVGFGFSRPGQSINVNAGYSGLVNDEFSPLTRTPYEAQRDDSYFGPARLLVAADLERAVLTGGQMLRAAVIGNLDTAEAEEEERDAYDSLLLGAGLDGPFSSGLSYAVFSYFQLNRYYESDEREIVLSEGNAVAAGFRLLYEMPALSASRVEAALHYASGDEKHPLFSDSGGGSSTQFVPYSESSLSLVYPVSFSNLLAGQLVYSLKLLQDERIPAEGGLLLEGGASFLYRPNEGAGTMSEPGFYLEEKGYMGTELMLAAEWQVNAGLSIGLRTGLYLPGGDFAGTDLFPDDKLLAGFTLTGSYRPFFP